MSGFGKWAETPYLPWKPAASFDAFGPEILEPGIKEHRLKARAESTEKRVNKGAETADAGSQEQRVKAGAEARIQEPPVKAGAESANGLPL